MGIVHVLESPSFLISMDGRVKGNSINTQKGGEMYFPKQLACHSVQPGNISYF